MKVRTFRVLITECVLLAWAPLHGAQYDLPIPAGSVSFGASVTVLSNGNFVVTDPDYRTGGGSVTNVGAVYLYDGLTLAMISRLTGSTSDDKVGNGGITVLPNGNYLVHSTSWNNGRGAVTWASSITGVDGCITPANSLIGVWAGDKVGNGGVTVLSNGNYLVSSTNWNSGRGAVTWGSAILGVSGGVCAANSLVGTKSDDAIGMTGIKALPNGNYLVSSPRWDNGFATNAGAVTWGSGTTGVSGEISESNSLVGQNMTDSVGSGGVTVLSNDQYVVSSPNWNGASAPRVGAVTWGSGATGVVGAVASTNSLVGQSNADQVGTFVTALRNGNYVVCSPHWSNGDVTNAGAITWGNGATGVTGPVSPTNSLVGSLSQDSVGVAGAIALHNGNYVVRSTRWNHGSVTNAGAVTWANGTAMVTGVVSAANSLVGGSANDQIGENGVTPLPNGNYVVRSESWDNGAATNVGAVTWGSGSTGVTGKVSAANSLVGSSTFDRVGYGLPMLVLTNGNYVVASPYWDNGTAADAGAATWGNGARGVTGVVSAANSLVGTSVGDMIGPLSPVGFTNYIVRSSGWDNGMIVNAGAVSWCSGTTGRTGAISAANSLVGSRNNDQVGSQDPSLLNNGHYLLRHLYWSNGTATNAGAVTWCSGTAALSGYVSAANSLVGGTTNDYIGNGGVTALSNGNYVISSQSWHDQSGARVGAATWGSGTGGLVGVVSAANSLVGATAEDKIGSWIDALGDGNYVVSSQYWNNGPVVDAGAITWGHGGSGVVGVVSPTNSLVGSSDSDWLGNWRVNYLGNGAYVVFSAIWDNGAITNAGVMTLGGPANNLTGVLSSTNSFVGTTLYGGNYLVYDDDPVHDRLLVGYPRGNRVSLWGRLARLTLEQPVNVNLVPGSTRTIYGVVGASSDTAFTIRNTGLEDLRVQSLSISGPDAPQFTVTPNLANVTLNGPSGNTNFVVHFAPTSFGSKTATLRVTSNSPDQNPFDINLLGEVLSSSGDIDGDGISDAGEFRLASLGFNWQVKQTNLCNTLYTNANFVGLYSLAQVQALNVDAPLLSRDPSSGLFTLTIGVQKAAQLTNFTPFPMPAAQTLINAQGELEFRFTVPDAAAFFRLEAR